MKLTLTIADAIARLTALLGDAVYTNPRNTFARWVIVGRFAVEVAMQCDGLAVLSVMEPTNGGHRSASAATVILAEILSR